MAFSSCPSGNAVDEGLRTHVTPARRAMERAGSDRSLIRRRPLAGVVLLGMTVLVGSAQAAAAPDPGCPSLLQALTPHDVGPDGLHFCHTVAEGESGVLAVIVRGAAGDLDLYLQVIDEYGQIVSHGSSDRDIGGRVGDEQDLFLLTDSGDYQLLIRSYGAVGDVEVAASWIGIDGVSSPDPDGVPATGRAQLLRIDDKAEVGEVGSTGDPWDWWEIQGEAGAAGVTVRIEAGQGDLVLEQYAAARHEEDWNNNSDDDLGGVPGNEELMVDGSDGPVFVRVRLVGPVVGIVSYSIHAFLGSPK